MPILMRLLKHLPDALYLPIVDQTHLEYCFYAQAINAIMVDLYVKGFFHHSTSMIINICGVSANQILDSRAKTESVGVCSLIPS